jgi:nucleoid DNA-binding protein
MPKYHNQLAIALLEDHPGIPDLKVSQEICESIIRVIKRALIKDGLVYLEDFGKLYIRTYKEKKKRDPLTKIVYEIAPKNLVRFKEAESLSKIINISRKKSKFNSKKD